MPYITKDKRTFLDLFINSCPVSESTEPGILNYVITSIIIKALGPKPNYTKFNAMIGMIECVKQELYRRAVSKYEDQKIKENGDVY